MCVFLRAGFYEANNNLQNNFLVLLVGGGAGFGGFGFWRVVFGHGMGNFAAFLKEIISFRVEGRCVLDWKEPGSWCFGLLQL